MSLLLTILLALTPVTHYLPVSGTNGYTDNDEYTKDHEHIFNVASPRIDLYMPYHVQGVSYPVILVCPGGGYRYLSCENEGINTAEYFTARGFAVAVLKYRLPNGHEDVPLSDACAAMCMLRDSAQAWSLRSDKIGVMGFSAGGHLAASLVTKYTSEKARPDYGVLVYPVISADTAIWHKGSFLNLCGKTALPSQLAAWSLENQVTENTPPCILVACEDDKSVPVENSVRFYQALRDHKVEAQMTLVPEGGHGWGFSRQFSERDLVETSMMEFIYRQLGNEKMTSVVRINREDIRREERHQNWARFDRYQQANDSIIANNIPVKAVFMGNSITNNWGNWRPEFFQKYNCAARGVSGQTSYQMLARMQADVFALHPEMVFILAGINDVACNSGVISDEHFMENIRSMCELSVLHGVRPMLCSILPSRNIPWNSEVGNPSMRIIRLNAMIKSYAEANGFTYVDYYSAMAAPDGGLRDGLSEDDVHPYVTSYEIMESVVIPYLEETMVTSSPSLTPAEQIRAKLLNPKCSEVLVASHRADWRGYPENSLEAMESAIRMGVDIIETDLQLTKDSVLIIMHDSKIDRTTTGHGRISEMTYDSISRFYLKAGHDIQTRYHIPTLREALILCKDRVLINLDKADRYFDLVVPLLEETGTTRQIIMKGRKSAEEVQNLYGRYLDDVIYMPIVNADKKEHVDDFRAHLKSRPCAFEVCYRSNDCYVKKMSCMAKGKSLLWVNTLWDTLCGGHEDDEAIKNPDAHYGYLINTLGFRVIQTDRPQFLIEYLKSVHRK